MTAIPQTDIEVESLANAINQAFDLSPEIREGLRLPSRTSEELKSLVIADPEGARHLVTYIQGHYEELGRLWDDSLTALRKGKEPFYPDIRTPQILAKALTDSGANFESWEQALDSMLAYQDQPAEMEPARRHISTKKVRSLANLIRLNPDQAGEILVATRELTGAETRLVFWLSRHVPDQSIADVAAVVREKTTDIKGDNRTRLALTQNVLKGMLRSSYPPAVSLEKVGKVITAAGEVELPQHDSAWPAISQRKRLQDQVLDHAFGRS